MRPTVARHPLSDFLHRERGRVPGSSQPGGLTVFESRAQSCGCWGEGPSTAATPYTKNSDGTGPGLAGCGENARCSAASSLARMSGLKEPSQSQTAIKTRTQGLQPETTQRSAWDCLKKKPGPRLGMSRASSYATRVARRYEGRCATLTKLGGRLSVPSVPATNTHLNSIALWPLSRPSESPLGLRDTETKFLAHYL